MIRVIVSITKRLWKLSTSTHKQCKHLSVPEREPSSVAILLASSFSLKGFLCYIFPDLVLVSKDKWCHSWADCIITIVVDRLARR